MSKMTIGVWGGIAATMFGLFRTSVPIEWGGEVGLLAFITAAILPLSWAFGKLARRKFR